ncbi:MAG: TRAP transporter substrate-binding protein [Candidatus Korobacteraceae bacterium]|jgi:tripartite ATP-independent transporter DctP family solute receptor
MKLTPIRLALVFAIAVGFAGSAAAKELRGTDTHALDYPTSQALVYWGKLIQERTQGRYSVKLYLLDELGGEKETIAQTQSGTLDFTRVDLAPLNNTVPETAIPALPYLFRSVAHMRKAMDGPVGDEILKALEPHGWIGLAYYDAGARSFYNTKRPIRTPADLRDLKLRVPQSDLFVAMMQALGATGTPIAFGEVFAALKAGVVDGAENNWPVYEETKHYEIAKYYSIDEHSLVPGVVLFSKKVWDTLSPEDQSIIRQAAKESIAYERKLWDARELESRAIVEKAGCIINTIPDKQQFSAAMTPVYDKFVTTPNLKDLVKRIQAIQ